MRKLSLEEVRTIQIEILDYIVDVCNINNLSVSLDAGTLLGAIRHKGYIPWDDDIDVTMPRADYNKFLEVMSKSKGCFQIMSMFTDDDYYYPFAKVIDRRTKLVEHHEKEIKNLGVYIDVFPQDDLPNDDSEAKRFQDKIWKMRKRISYAGIRQGNIISFIKHPRHCVKIMFYSMIGWQSRLKKLNIYVQSYNNDKALYCDQLVSTSSKYRKMLKSYFNAFSEVEFEGKKYPAVMEYDKYLTQGYGDYMKLPPMENQVSHHFFSAYLLDESK